LSIKNQKTGCTVEVKAEVINDEVAGGNSRKPPKNFHGGTKKIGSLPWREMFTYYVRGERVIDGGLKHNTTPSYEDVAIRYNCAKQTVAAFGRKNDWVKKRDAYRSKLSNEFSFYGQMAADINGEVLSTAAGLVKKIKARVFDPTFLPDRSRIVELDGEFFIEADVDGSLISLSSEVKNPSKKTQGDEIKSILDLTKSLETINRICNSTVQVEIDNASLLEAQSDSLVGEEERAEFRMRQIEEMTQRIGHKRSTASKRERLAQARSVKQVNQALRKI
jgi:hypothetical protein